MTKKRIFITGGSGCVGHYLADMLINQTEHELFFLVRHPDKLKFNFQSRPGVHLVTGDLQNISPYIELLSTMNCVVLLATQWGGAGTFAVNVTGNTGIMQALNPEICEQVIYFSTASILDQNLQLLPPAKDLGTEYIRSKFICYEELAQLPIYDRLTVMFPTLIFGGEKDKPPTHISTGLDQLPRYLQWARWVRADGCFHFIHAQDIAQILMYYLAHPAGEFRQFVLGNEVIWLNQAVQELCAYFGMNLPRWQFNLTPRRVALLMQIARWLGAQLIPWDDFCAEYRYFRYDPVLHPARLGLTPRCQTLGELLPVLGISPTTSNSGFNQGHSQSSHD
ncbi:Nucleoside-diphosphate-sugar epimerase [Gloeomargarita lithophora Alchichica-D10]|uniref:Nucleoside-diphosphate-sugar epimerase n=1 Tax=Gloeomargarita lithophora Alchichica-D10 TaxID=1188229 RepID=A0A1J0A9W9_9CYAN|nr:NAD(P)-dependent oxidoreductase [Gloeomargarita lithophora]APB32709.1 Nucleoside-diphosphate-sugar epimerase [Gloeomargarita lithophora Alchichica-D10]